MTMDDIELSMGDNNRTMTLAKAYGYHKTSIPYHDFNELVACPYLGGPDARNRLEIKADWLEINDYLCSHVINIQSKFLFR